MESVMTDLLNATENASIETILTQTCGFVRALDNASKSMNNAMRYALRKDQSVETSASAVQMKLTVSITTVSTTEIAMATALTGVHLVPRTMNLVLKAMFCVMTFA